MEHAGTQLPLPSPLLPVGVFVCIQYSLVLILSGLSDERSSHHLSTKPAKPWLLLSPRHLSVFSILASLLKVAPLHVCSIRIFSADGWMTAGQPPQRHLRVHGVVLALRRQPRQVRGDRVDHRRDERPACGARPGLRAPRTRDGEVRQTGRGLAASRHKARIILCVSWEPVGCLDWLARFSCYSQLS